MNKFLDLLNERRDDYKTWVPVYSSAIREYVFFNMVGFNHLRFKPNNTPRDPKVAMYKLGLLPLVRPAIHKATSVSQYKRMLGPIGGSRKVVLKEFEYWGLVAVIGKRNTKVKVVLRRAVNGDRLHFWSVMKLGENQKAPEGAF